MIQQLLMLAASRRLFCAWQRCLLLAALLGMAPAAFAQTSIYALATTYSSYYGTGAAAFTSSVVLYPKGAQALVAINPASGQAITTNFSPIVGVTAGQVLVGIDYRPANGLLYGLGYDTLTTNAQLYVLTPTTVSGITTSTASAVNAVPVPLALGNVSGAAGSKRIGFDFNPVADRIRVVSANGANYRLNPDTGGVVARDTDVSYSSSDPVTMPIAVSNPPTISPNPPTTPGIGSVAYTNSYFGAATTTLYADDELHYGILSVQSPPNMGNLTAPKMGSFNIPGQGVYQLTDRLVALDIDVYYNRSTGQNTAYLSEVTDGRPSAFHASNLYTLDLTTGQATRIGNIIPSVSAAPFFPNRPAAPVDITDIAVVISAPLIWSGFVSDEWNLAGNWVPNRVPTSADDVLIPGSYTPGTPPIFPGTTPTPNQPTVRSTQQALSVTLNTGATLSLVTGGTLNVSGNFTSTGGTVAGGGTGTVALVSTGTTVQVVGGSALLAFPNLRVGAAGTTTPGATTTGPVAIRSTGGLMLYSNLAIGSGQAFTLTSDASGTAYVVNNAGAVATGTATVQRYITPNLNGGPGYRHYSTPVSGNTVADFAVAGVYTPTVNPSYNSSATPGTTSPFPTIYYYDQSRLGLANNSPEFDRGFASPNSTSDPLTVGLGYTVNLPATALVDFVGTLNTGVYTSASLGRGTQAFAGYQLLGNPYPGAIDYNTVLGLSSNMESALYVFKSSGQYTGTYTSYVNGRASNSGTNILPTAQGFFARVQVGQTGTVRFTDAARTNAPDNTPFQRTAADIRPSLTLTLRNATLANQTVVYFEQGATAGFDTKYDAHYLRPTHGLDLATDISTELLAINGQPALTGAAVTVPLQLHAAGAGSYTLAVDELANLPAGYHAYLRDALSGTYTDLATTPSISLTLAPADPAAGRYALVFTTSQALAAAPAATAQLVSIYPNPAQGTATLLVPQALRTGVATAVVVVDNLGRTVLTSSLVAGTDLLALPLATLAPGIYSVQAQTSAGVVAKRLVVQ